MNPVLQDWRAIAAGAGMLLILGYQLWKGAALRIDRRTWIPFIDEFPEFYEFFSWRDESALHFWLSIASQVAFFTFTWCLLFAW